MSLDLRNFVNININYNKINVSSVERGIVTLITKNPTYSNDPYEKSIFYSVDEYNAAKKASGIVDTSLDVYVKSFFGNKGKALRIIGGYTSGSVSDFIISVLNNRLDYKHVIIVSDADEQDLRLAASSTASTTLAPNALFPEDNTVPTFSGFNEKMFISSTTDRSDKLFNSVLTSTSYIVNTYFEFNEGTGQYELLTGSEPADWATPKEAGSSYNNYFQVATPNLQNYVVKVGEKGIEMLAAAYLSKVRISDASTIQDYAFTIEDVNSYFSNSIVEENNEGVNLIRGNKNFDSELVNAIRNYPGDTIHGEDMMNYYIKILITQDLTEAIMNLLSSKIRFNQSGINRLNNAISQQMNVYVSNGYLNTDYIWTGDDLYYSFNGVDYLICSRNTPLVKGYKCVILPLTSLTSAQKEGHVLPPVYILLADQTGIRVVVINGDVY